MYRLLFNVSCAALFYPIVPVFKAASFAWFEKRQGMPRGWYRIVEMVLPFPSQAKHTFYACLIVRLISKFDSSMNWILGF